MSCRLARNQSSGGGTVPEIDEFIPERGGALTQAAQQTGLVVPVTGDGSRVLANAITATARKLAIFTYRTLKTISARPWRR